MKQRADEAIRTGQSPAWTALQVLIALMLDISRYRRERTTPP